MMGKVTTLTFFFTYHRATSMVVPTRLAQVKPRRGDFWAKMGVIGAMYLHQVDTVNRSDREAAQRGG
jgi:hypothetical protein